MNREHSPFIGVTMVTAAATCASRTPGPRILHGVPVIEAAHGLSSGFTSVAATPESKVGLPAVAATPRGCGGELPGEGQTPERATGAIDRQKPRHASDAAEVPLALPLERGGAGAEARAGSAEAGADCTRGTYNPKRPVHGVNPQTLCVVEQHESLSQAARSLKIGKSTMSSLIRSGNIREGLQWQYADHQDDRGTLGAPTGQALHGGSRPSSREVMRNYADMILAKGSAS
jgi:hypothetical protein